MAIKGKKKSQSRGSQGQRRPAAAPRPVYTGRRHVPWYKKPEGRLIGGMLIAVVVGVAIWLVADAQNESKQRTATRESLEDYVQSLRSFTNTLGPVAEEMDQVPGTEVEPAQLRKDAGEWTTDLSSAQAQIASVPPPDEAEVASRLFDQSMASFLAAARLYETATDAEGDLQTQLISQANQEVQQARGLFDAGVVALDEELADVGGQNSNLLLPQGTTPLPQETTEGGSNTIEVPTDTGNGGGGQGGGGGGNGGGGQGDGN